MQIAASYHQERIWFIDRFERGSLYDNGPVYHNIPLIIEIKGVLNIKMLEKSIYKVLKRHEVLRTKVQTIDHSVCQSIAEDFDFRLNVLELPKDKNADKKEDILDVLLELNNNAFNHGIDDFLFKGVLLKVNEVHNVLLLTIHHFICDMTSKRIIANEISAFYDAYSNASDIDADELLLQYADFSSWQKNMPAEEMEYLQFYWRRKLSGKLKALEMLTDHKRAAIHVYKAERYEFEFPVKLYEKLKRFGALYNKEIRDILLSVYSILLSRYSNQEEIIIGTSMQNRLQEELEGVVGPIANLVVLRNNIKKQMTFLQAVEEIAQNFSEAEEYQGMPFDKLVLDLNPENDMSRTALFDMLFQYEEVKKLNTNGKCIFNEIETNLGWGKYDFNMLIRQDSGSLSGIMTYNIDYYNTSTIKRVIKHLFILASNLLDNPEEDIGKVSLIGEEEKNTVLYEWNNTNASYPQEACIHTLFIEQVDKTPDSIAVKHGNKTISYKELDAMTNTLAVIIREKGIKPNDIAAMVLDRSELIVIAMLAILKAGGAYLPVASDYPQERVDFLLQDSKAKLILTTSDVKEKFTLGGNVICLDETNLNEKTDKVESVNTPEDMAYIIYTSGTTGNPKGVMIEHKNVVRLMVNDRFQFDFNSKDVWTMFHSYNFDFSVWEMYGALLYGGKLIIVPKMTSRDTKSFRELLVKEEVTVLNQTPPAFYNLINEELTAPVAELSLRYIIFGGEALSPLKLKEWKERYKATKLINMYGITETTVHVTYKEITEYEIENNISNIGKPIPTLTTYIMDSHMNLLPAGIAGELCVGGDGVARGYLNLPDMTNQKFVKNPYKPDEIIYRSGDLARYLENGEMEYMGRIDNQVKVSGFRIELGEIESFILKQDGIKQVVVAARKDTGETRLVAYIIWEETASRDINGLKSCLKKLLPEYMIPSVFVSMAIFPLTSNGKIDRKSLPLPKEAERSTNEEYIAPETELEIKIADMWRDILEIQRVGVNDNFFSIGGNSLLITKLVYKFNEFFKSNLSFPYFFSNPTIKSMAEFIKNSSVEGKRDEGQLPVRLKLEDEVILDEAITGVGLPHINTEEINEIFITGVTGFLGAFLLNDLLKNTKACLYCLVRAVSKEEGIKRIRDNMSYYLLSCDELEKRVIPVIGDLEKPLMGLSKELFSLLAEKIDVIYHNGAVTKFVYPYEKLKGINVIGTREVLRMASSSRLKPVHYISTVSVFASTFDEIIYEDQLPEIPAGHAGGYAQSKWVAEGLIRAARSRGVPVNIYRPGRIFGHSETGACQTNDFLWQIIKVCVEVGAIFESETAFDIIPVDYVSKAVVEISRNGATNGNYNIYNPNCIFAKDIYNWINSLGYELELVSYGKWYEKVKNAALNEADSMAAKLISLLDEEQSSNYHNFNYDIRNTCAMVKDAGPKGNECENIFKRNFKFLGNKGFIKKVRKGGLYAGSDIN